MPSIEQNRKYKTRGISFTLTGLDSNKLDYVLQKLQLTQSEFFRVMLRMAYENLQKKDEITLVTESKENK